MGVRLMSDSMENADYKSADMGRQGLRIRASECIYLQNRSNDCQYLSL